MVGCVMRCCIDSCCSHRQYESPYIAHVVRGSHHYCMCSYCPCGQHVSPYISQIASLAIYRTNQYRPHGHNGSHILPHGHNGSHILRGVIMDPICCPCSHDVSPYIAHVARVSHNIALVQTVPHKPSCNHDDHANIALYPVLKKR